MMSDVILCNKEVEMVVKVSVIVPVYNAEKYIARCIESLLLQTLINCEFIFINDGSVDKSKFIIERYRKQDKRIILINQENQGVSIARNNGLEAATGEYIGFVDADDVVEKDMYETLYLTAKQNQECDVVLSNYESEIEGHKVTTRYQFPKNVVFNKEYIEQEVLPYFLQAEDLNTACSKLYKTKLLKEKQLKFPEKVTLGEDGLFNLQFFSNASTMLYIDYTGYHYKEVIGSATRNMAEKNYFNRALEVYNLRLPDVYRNKLDKESVQKLKSIKLINSVMSLIYVYFKPTREVSFRKRYKLVSEMAANKVVRESLIVYYKERYSSLGRYEKCIISLLRRRSTVGLYLATNYSRLRNKYNWRITL
jgi:glycosyltransferase involved in cell wall biosynthesis